MPEKYREKCGEQRAGSRKQRAESKGRCPPGDNSGFREVITFSLSGGVLAYQVAFNPVKWIN